MPPQDPLVEEQGDVVLVRDPETGATQALSRARFEAQGQLAAPEVSTTELANIAETEANEAAFGQFNDQLATAAEGFASGATFGITDALLADRESRIRASVNPGSRFAGNLAGSILPGVFSGGTGLLGTAARLTPAGRLAAVSGRIAAGGTTAGARIARGVAAGALEGAAEGLGSEISRQALTENADFSAQTLLGAAGGGALLGGAIGGGARFIGEGVSAIRARRAAEATPLERLLDAADEGTDAATRRAAKETNIADIVSRQGRDQSPQAFSQLIGTIDDTAKLARGKELSELISTPGVVLRKAEQDTMHGLLDDLEVASAEANRWAHDYTDALGVDDLQKATREQLGKAVPDALDDQGAVLLAALDDKAEAYRAGLAQIRVSAGVPSAADTALLAETAAKAKGKWARLADFGTTAIGVSETARDLGIDLPIPSVSDIPIFGKALGLYARFKAGGAALRKFGGGKVPTTASTQAAGKVNSARSRISGAVNKAARGVLKVAANPAVKRIASVGARSVMRSVMATDPAEVEADARAATAGAPPDVVLAAAASASRSVQYLQAEAPKNPLAGTALAGGWEPNQTDLDIWARRATVVADPEAAVLKILTDPSAAIEAETLRIVAPAVWAEARSNVERNAVELVEKLPENRLLAIGAAFDVPLSASQIIGYGTQPRAVPEMAPQARPGGGTPTNSSPLVRFDETVRR